MSKKDNKERTSIFEILQKNGLVPSIGGNDDNYKALMAASESIAQTLLEDKTKIIPYTLIALDKNISEDEPLMEEIENEISEHWKTIRSHFQEMPIPLYQAIILQGLENLVGNDEESVSIIWFCSMDIFPLLDLNDKERRVLGEFIGWLGNEAEKIAISKWSMEQQEIKLVAPKFNLKIPLAKVKIDTKKLELGFARAAGPHKIEENRQIEGANRYWPQNNQHWVSDFGKIAGQHVSRVIGAAMEDKNQSLASLGTALNSELSKYFKTLGEQLKKSFSSTLNSSSSVENRSKIMWWKEALYSPKVRDSYRNLDPFQTTIAMAVDLYEILPGHFPHSVDFILREAFRSAQGDENKKIKLIDYLKECDSLANGEFIKNYLGDGDVLTGRMDLGSFIKKIVHSKTNLEGEIDSSLGISGDQELSHSDISVWILHSLSAKYLTKN